MKLLYTYLSILIIAIFYFSNDAYSARRIGLIVDTGYQGFLYSNYGFPNPAAKNFRPDIAEKKVSISRIGVLFQGEYTCIGLSFIFGTSNIERKDWNIDVTDNHDTTYTIRDYFDIYEHKKSYFGTEMDFKIFFSKINYKKINFYALINLGLLYEKCRKVGEEEIKQTLYNNYADVINYQNNYNDWYNNQRTGYMRSGLFPKNLFVYAGIGFGMEFYIFGNLGIDIRISGIFDSFGAALFLRGSIGVFFMFF